MTQVSGKISTYADEMLNLLEKAKAEEQRLLNVSLNINRQIMKVVPANKMGGINSSIAYYSDSGYGSWGRERGIAETCRVAKEKADELLAISKRIHEENKEALENNKLLREAVEFFMRKIGLADSYYRYEFKTPRSRNKELIKKPAGWPEDVRREIVIYDGFDLAERAYNDQIKRIEEYRKSKEKEEQAKKDEAAAIEKKKATERELAVLVVKYDLHPMSEWDEVMEHLLSKDKYLRLADALLQQRNDWSQGFSISRDAIHSFKIETDEDQRIFESLSEISETVEDGRQFRDCQYNYNVLFEKADPALYTDYCLAQNKISKY